MSHLATAILLSASVALLVPPGAEAASFNCNTADKPDEVLICQNPQLSALDDRLSSLYFTLRNRLSGAQRSALETNQTAWLNSRFACGRDYGCIETAYQRQIRVLMNW